MAIPKLSARNPIATPGGAPTSQFLQFMESVRVDQTATDARQDAVDIELAAINAAQDVIISDLADVVAAQAVIVSDLAVEVDRLTNVLNGTTSFTGLNVGGTNVKPFLDKTDGSKITSSTALDSSTVVTATVAQGDIVNSTTAFTAGNVTWSEEADSAKTAQTVSGVVVERGSVLISFDLFTQFTNCPSSNNSTLRLYRGGTELTNAQQIQAAISHGSGVHRIVQRWSIVNFPDSPGAGTHEYSVTFQPGYAATTFNGGGSMSGRSLTVIVVEA
jgi:uncharacterized coiled-coil protein SlyX